MENQNSVSSDYVFKVVGIQTVKLIMLEEQISTQNQMVQQLQKELDEIKKNGKQL